jgi:hypothetical protein
VFTQSRISRLYRHSASDDESVEEFAAMLREWRSEGVPAKRPA